MDFVLNGRAMHLTAAEVMSRLRDVQPEVVQRHGVRIAGVTYPVKQAFEVATGVNRAHFTSHTARRHLHALGFTMVGHAQPRDPGTALVSHPEPSSALDARPWPWEGEVQALFAAHLEANGWLVDSAADTATKARGVDLLAHRGGRRLGAEVKGWPSKGFADPRRAAEVKVTQPSTQAEPWFAQALLKAVMLLDSHPGRESLMVLPDFPRYRDLTQRTRTGRAACSVHVVFITDHGEAHSDTWAAGAAAST